MVNSRDRMMKAAIPLVYLFSEEGQEINASIPVSLKWSTEYYKTAEFTVTDDLININKSCSGLYEIIVSCRCEADTGDPWFLGIYLRVNGITVYDGHCESHAVIDKGGTSGTAILHTVIYLNAGDYIEIRAWVDDGTAFIDSSTSIIIKGIPMEGWNNAHAGKILKKETLEF